MDNVRRANKRKLFTTDDGHPAGFFFHSSIRSVGQRRQLKADIEANGGRVVLSDIHADTVLIAATEDKRELRQIYSVDDDPRKRRVHVEKLSFVQNCIKQRSFKHRPPIIKGMGGQIGIVRRVNFTEEDDLNLEKFLARMMPRKEAGGRTGMKVYEFLYRLGKKGGQWEWVKRHTVHSWRERYKMNQEYFDPHIEQIARAEGTFENQIWPEDRRMSKRRRRMREEEEEETDEAEAEHEEEEGQEEYERGSLDQEVEGGEYDHEPFEVPQEEEPEEQEQELIEAPGQRQSSEEVSPMQWARDKGKSRSYESEHDEEEMKNTSLFSIDDDEEVPFEVLEDEQPGPSNIFRSPDRTLAEPPSRRGRQSRENITFMTQETLVNSQAANTMDFDPVSHSTSANRRRSGNTTGSQRFVRTMEEQRLGFASSPPPPATKQSPSPQMSPPPRTVIEQQSPPVTQSRHRGFKARPQVEPPLTIVHTNDEAPYRNTRSRSRGVKSTATQSQKRGVETETIPEEIQEEEQPNHAQGSVPVTETIGEEMDVENILMAVETNQSVVTRQREPSLETDDAQTRQALRAGSQAGGPPTTTFSSNRIKAWDVLRRADESRSSSRRYAVPPFQRSLVHGDLPAIENGRPHKNEPQSQHARSGVAAGTFKLPEPRTPRRQSGSSSEPFPIRGTRASAEKKQRQEREKYTPYRPHERTRAAQITMSR